MSDSRADSTVLIVDDDADLVDVTRHHLQDTYDVRTATSGEAALERMDEDVDVVLLDRRMPGMTGDEVLREIRIEEYDVRVVMLTGVAPDFDIVDMGFDDYMVKPVSGEDIRSTVDEMLTRAEFYDDELRRRLTLASKRAVLQTEKTTAERENSEKYEELQRELEGVHDRVDRALSRVEGDAPDRA